MLYFFASSMDLQRALLSKTEIAKPGDEETDVRSLDMAVRGRTDLKCTWERACAFLPQHQPSTAGAAAASVDDRLWAGFVAMPPMTRMRAGNLRLIRELMLAVQETHVGIWG